MRWNSPANWSPRFWLWRRVRFLNLGFLRSAARRGRNQPKGVLDFRRTGSLVRHRSILPWIMKSGRLDPGPEKPARAFARTSRDRQRREALRGKRDFADQ